MLTAFFSPALSNEDLKGELGVTSLGHRKKIIDEIQMLATQGSVQAPPGCGPSYVQAVFAKQPSAPPSKPSSAVSRPSSSGRTISYKIPQRNAQVLPAPKCPLAAPPDPFRICRASASVVTVF